MAVLLLAFVGTLINLAFGWIAPLVRTIPVKSVRDAKGMPVPVTAKASKQF
ncbi:hypothetical protein ACPOL_4411 [Acidisarcina polymorpha]|uniref:Uncharacterized protein n=1 Tax=Acidisarcina polymorpha TaxID=2211140 RepID=A0A2Z5G4C5_9BACT|nr:hypothetical protein ACPOL_4411 [Acidisarcina polymorpha]